MSATGRDRAAVGRERQAQDLDAPLVGPPDLPAILGVEEDQDGALLLASEPVGRRDRAAVGRVGHGLDGAGQPACLQDRRTRVDVADHQLAGPTPAGLTPRAGPGGDPAPSGEKATHQTSRPWLEATQVFRSEWPSRWA